MCLLSSIKANQEKKKETSLYISWAQLSTLKVALHVRLTSLYNNLGVLESKPWSRHCLKTTSQKQTWVKTDLHLTFEHFNVLRESKDTEENNFILFDENEPKT